MTTLMTPGSTRLDTLRNRLEPTGLPTAPSAMQVLRILARVSWWRFRNQVSVIPAFFGRKKATEESASPRPATPGKGKMLFGLYLWLALTFLVGSALQTVGFVERMSDQLSPKPAEGSSNAVSDHPDPDRQVNGPVADQGTRQEGVDSGKTDHPGPRWPLPPDDQLLVLAMGLIFLVFSLGILAFQLGGANQDLGKVNWDLEWLFTFPVSAQTLFLARLVQYATTSPFMMLFWLSAAPSLAVLYRFAGYGWWAVPLALAATGYSAFLIASLCLVIETWVQKRSGPSRRKNLQAVFGLIGGPLFLFSTVALSQGTFDALILRAVHQLPALLWANPFSLPVLLCERGWAPLGAGAGMALFGVAVPFGSVRLAGRLVRDGLVAAPGAYQGSRGQRQAGRRKVAGWLRGIVGKEVRLLGRDKAFLAQTLILPVMMFGFYFFMYWQAGTRLIHDPCHAAMMAFSLGVYMLAVSGFNVLAAEGGALWLLYTFPRKLRSILLEKTFLWAGLASLYGLMVLAIAALAGMPLSGQVLVEGAVAVVGIVIYAFIAAAMGTLAANPLEAMAQRRFRLDLMYFFMALASFYAAAIYSPSLWPMVVQVALSALVAVALWQKVQDRIPYLLEPALSPPPSISLADGLIAVLAFSTVQTLLLVGMQAAQAQLAVGTQVLIATGAAGMVVALGSFFCLRKVPGFLTLTGLVASATDARPTMRRVLVPGVLAGVVAGLFGVAYMAAVGRIDGLRSWEESLVAVPSPLADPAWFAWVVLAAPLFEEFIFRGLIYRGMQRSVPPAVAVLGSAALFAMVHPSFKVLPVFVLGVAAALSYKRSGLLWTSIVTHMVYNAIVVAAVWMM